jgi:hypothetical protein
MGLPISALGLKAFTFRAVKEISMVFRLLTSRNASPAADLHNSCV